MAKRKIVGIDLGTTYSAIAHFDHYGKVDVLPNSDNDRTTPSVVLFEDGEAIVGRIAKSLAVSNPDKVIQFVKRNMGAPDWQREIDGQVFTPELLSAMILKRIVADGEQQLGCEITDVVITCPAYFNDNERRLTREAGRIAGLNVLGIVNESTAAAIAYGLNNLDKQVRALVFDLGGGTLDVTILEIEGNNVRVLATDGERLLGGKDWDQVIINRVAEEFFVMHGVDPREDAESHQDLIIRAEEAKRALSTKPRTKVFVQCKGHSLKAELTRADFEKLSRPLLRRAEACLERTLKKAKLEWSQVDTLLQVGGSTRMPAVRQSLAEISGLDSDQWVNPDECVAMGATYWAAILMLREAERHRKDSEKAVAPKMKKEAYETSIDIQEAVPEDLIVILGDMAVTNVNSHSLGVLSLRGKKKVNRVMIPEQTPIPHSVTREFVTAQDGQTTVEIRILEGASTDPERCVKIGKCKISGLPKGRKKGARVRVRYAYGEDGVIEIHAKDVETGKEVRTEIEPNAVSLTDSQLDFSGRRVTHLLDKGKVEEKVAGDSDINLINEFNEGLTYED